jgi:hypothetical protein
MRKVSCALSRMLAPQRVLIALALLLTVACASLSPRQDASPGQELTAQAKAALLSRVLGVRAINLVNFFPVARCQSLSLLGVDSIPDGWSRDERWVFRISDGAWTLDRIELSNFMIYEIPVESGDRRR